MDISAHEPKWLAHFGTSKDVLIDCILSIKNAKAVLSSAGTIMRPLRSHKTILANITDELDVLKCQLSVMQDNLLSSFDHAAKSSRARHVLTLSENLLSECKHLKRAINAMAKPKTPTLIALSIVRTSKDLDHHIANVRFHMRRFEPFLTPTRHLELR